MNDVLPDLNKWIDRGDRIAMATVVAVKKSAPRPPGAKMAVNEDGEIIGAVSGGCVEGAVVEIADQVLRGGQPQLVHFGIADEQAWDVGLPCGGEIDVWVQEYAPGRFAEIASAGGRAAEVTLLEGDDAGHEDPVRGGRRPDPGRSARPSSTPQARRAAEDLLWAETSELQGPLFVDVVAPAAAPDHVRRGADRGRAVHARRGRPGGGRSWSIRAGGSPPGAVPRRRASAGRRGPTRRSRSWAGSTRQPRSWSSPMTPSSMTRRWMIALRSPARFVGAMGSRRAQESRRERLLAAGMTDEELARMSAPVGLDLGAVSAEETALSILAEVVATRHGRDGGRLTAAGGRIHEVPPERPSKRGAAAPLECGRIYGPGANDRRARAGRRRRGAVRRRQQAAGRARRAPAARVVGRRRVRVPALERVVVVLGSRADDVLASGRGSAAPSPSSARTGSGQAASLRCGLEALAGASKVIVTLGDAPLVTPAVIALFVGEPGRTRAVYGGRPGPPGGARPEQIAALKSLSGDRGARDLLRGGPVIEVGHLCSGRDVDTPEDLEAIRDEARAVI